MEPFEIALTPEAVEDIGVLTTFEQRLLLDAIEARLAYEPLTETRNRKPLEPNDLSAWEMRVGRLRVFYDVDTIERRVTVKAAGWKEREKLIIRGKEYRL